MFLLFLLSLLVIDPSSAAYNNNVATARSCTSSSVGQAKRSAAAAKSEQRARDRQVVMRPYCKACHRPVATCLCSELPASPIATAQTDIIIVQHPREFRKRTVSTVPLLQLVLQNVRLVVGESLSEAADMIAATNKYQHRLLLFPGKHAQSLEEYSSTLLQTYQPDDDDKHSSSPNKKKILLILVDGTWSQAKRMVRDSSPQILAQCTRVQLPTVLIDSTTTTSTARHRIYHAIRREPHATCTSTLEAVAMALPWLEQQQQQRHDNATAAVTHLYAALQKLVTVQVQYTSTRHHGPKRQRPGHMRKSLCKNRQAAINT